MIKSFLLTLVLVGTAWAQLSDAEAQRRLAELNAKAKANPAAAVAPSTQAVATSQPGRSPVEIHAAAVALMRAGQYAKAGPLIERAYKLTPPAALTRPLTLNRALVDYMVGTNVQRAVKDLSAYVALHPNDEEAVNRLGAAGRKAMDSTQHFENTQLCQDSERVLASAIAQLEAGRPGFRKWGTGWLKDSEFSSIAFQQHRAQGHLDYALERLRSAQKRVDEANGDAAAQNTINTAAGTRGTGIARYGTTDTIAQQQQDQQRRAADAQSAQGRAGAEYREAMDRVDAARREFPQPDWSTTFEPLDPNAIADTPDGVPADPKMVAASTSHELAVGMTLEQAEASLGPATLVSDNGRHQTYRWTVHTPTATPSMASGIPKEDPNAHSTFTATFEGGRLKSFSRH